MLQYGTYGLDAGFSTLSMVVTGARALMDTAISVEGGEVSRQESDGRQSKD